MQADSWATGKRMALLRFLLGTGILYTLTNERCESNVTIRATSRTQIRGYHSSLLLTVKLRYWNWMLDWEDVTKAPVWDPENGFGGNGDPDVGESIVKGHCVTDGPFAMLEVLYLKSELKPHCLSRGFESGTALAQLGQGLRPQVLEDLLAMGDYETFNLGLEDGPHISIPRSIRGDFSLFTAPYGMHPLPCE